MEFIMASFDTSIFDFSSMSQAMGNPFEQATSKYSKDDRFYTLTKDKETGAGVAQIMFLPDADKHMIQKVYKINTTISKNGKKRFVSELSPTTINLPCPFQEKWAELYNAGRKDEAKLFSRNQRYYVNILVINDPNAPQNNGKVFLYDMSRTMADKLRSALEPSEQDLAFGAERKEIFNPLKGWSLILKSKKGANGIISYDDSEFKQIDPQVYAKMFGPLDEANIQTTAQKVIDLIKTKTHNLGEFLDAKAYKTYDELKKKLEWVTFADIAASQTTPVENVQVAQAQVATPEVQAAAAPQVSQAPANPAPQAQSGGFDVNSFINTL
jgi:hypothetical protein